MTPQRSANPFLCRLSLGIRFGHIFSKNSSGDIWEGMGTAGNALGVKDEIYSTAKNLWLLRMGRTDNEATGKREKHFCSHSKLGLQIGNGPKLSLEVRTHPPGQSGILFFLHLKKGDKLNLIHTSLREQGFVKHI